MSEPSNNPNPNPSPESEPTRRAMMAQAAMAAAAAMVEANRAAAQPVPPGAAPPPGGRHGSFQHFDVPPGPRRPAPQSVDLTEEQLKTAWKTLGEIDAVKANAAFNQIFSAKKAAPFLKEQLKAIDGIPDEKKVQQLLKDMVDETAAQKAIAELVEIGPGILRYLDPAKTNRFTLPLLTKLKATPAYLQGHRGLQILNELPMKEAKAVLADIKKQEPGTWLTITALLMGSDDAPMPKPVPVPVPPAPKPNG